jgi:enamine deaminase RidA (YjgF/YER057c/UK114 family)
MSQLINPPNIRPPHPIYSHVMKTPISPTSTLITIAGQIGVPPDSSTAAPTFSEQVQVALSNLRKCLEAAGATPADIIKVTHYIVNLDPTDKSRLAAYTQFIGDHRPPSTLVGVAALAWPDLLYEIDAMAIVHQKSKEGGLGS